MSNLAPEFWVDDQGRLLHEARMYLLSLTQGGSAAAPGAGTFVTTVAEPGLPNSRRLVDSNSVKVSLATAGQVALQRAALTGDVTATLDGNATTLSNTGVTAATYGDSTHVGQFTVDAKGRLTAAANVAIGETMQKATVTLTNTQIKDLGVPTAVTIASALGANIILVPLWFVMKAYTSAGAYTGLTNGAFLQIEYSNSELAAGYIPNDSTTTPAITLLSDLLGSTINRILKLHTPFMAETDPLSNAWGDIPIQNTMDTQNKSLRIVGSGFAGAFGGGNAGNSLVIDTYYLSVPI